MKLENPLVGRLGRRYLLIFKQDAGIAKLMAVIRNSPTMTGLRRKVLRLGKDAAIFSTQKVPAKRTTPESLRRA